MSNSGVSEDEMIAAEARVKELEGENSRLTQDRTCLNERLDETNFELRKANFAAWREITSERDAALQRAQEYIESANRSFFAQKVENTKLRRILCHTEQSRFEGQGGCWLTEGK